ncbi:MAG: type I methionyl aminopeptidase [Firmicutes bacterium]|nr:type I methionyl aminopeptidase [Bacillota bacterium]
MKNIKVYNTEQLDNVRQSGKILSHTLVLLQESLRSGISTLELDRIAEDYIRSSGAEPSFQNYNGYKYSICTSINEESIHGMPRKDKILKDGDIISIDVGVRFNGMCTDAARTFAIGEISDEAKHLIQITEQSFFEAIRGLKAMSKVGDIGERIENYIRVNSTYSIVDRYFGHGVGEKVHEDPLIPNFIPPKKSIPKLKEIVRTRLPLHSVIAIEPMINMGVKDLKTASDKWTAITVDGKLAAHYENTLIILENGVEVVTLTNN